MLLISANLAINFGIQKSVDVNGCESYELNRGMGYCVENTLQSIIGTIDSD